METLTTTFKNSHYQLTAGEGWSQKQKLGLQPPGHPGASAAVVGRWCHVCRRLSHFRSSQIWEYAAHFLDIAFFWNISKQLNGVGLLHFKTGFLA